VAVEPTRLVTYEAAAFRDLVSADPEFCAAVAPALLATLSDRLTTSWHQLLDLFGGQLDDPW
jgi:CRP-like cAMP-binding protein